MKDLHLRYARAMCRAFIALPLLSGCQSDTGTDTTNNKDSENGDTGEPDTEMSLPVEMWEGVSENLLIDDFEDEDELNTTGGFWMTFDDRHVDGTSEVWPPSHQDGKFESDAPGYDDTGYAAHLVGKTGSEAELDFVGLMSNLHPDAFCPKATPTDIDVNAYDGVQFMAKGSISSGVLVFKLFHAQDGEADNCDIGYPNTLTGFADYQTTFQEELTDEWSLVRIPFADLAQPSWGTIAASLDDVLAHLKSLTWQYEASDGEVDLWIDDVTLYKVDPDGEEVPELIDIYKGTSKVLMIDDFDDGDSDNEIGGFWSTSDDRLDGGKSEVWPPPWYEEETFESDEPGYGDTGRAAHVKGTTGDVLGWDNVSVFTSLGADVYCPFFEPTHIDLNAYDGVQFIAKGETTGGALRFIIYHIKDGPSEDCEDGEAVSLTEWADYMYDFKPKLTKQWSLVRIPFADLRQPDWAEILVPIDEVLTHAKTFTWRFEMSGGEADFWIDSVSLYKEGETSSQPDTPDMEIHAPKPPEDEVIEDIDIENPLQALAEAVLNRGYNVASWLEQKDFDGFGEYDETFVENLAANGFEALRLPIDLDQYIENREAYFEGEADFAVNPVLFDILDTFETWTASHGLSLTIDYHQYDKSMDPDDPKDVTAAALLWSAVAEHFKDNPREDLFFELMNEPEQSAGVDAVSQETWTSAAEKLIAAIREHDANRVIIFGDVNWYGISALTERTPFSDDRIIYAFHFYEPYLFTSQGTNWSGSPMTVHDIPYPYTEERWSEYYEDFGIDPDVHPSWYMQQVDSYYINGNKSALRNAIVEAKRWAAAHQVPVICNEFGAFDRESRLSDRVRYYTDLVDIFDELRIPRQHWFQIMDTDTGEIAPELKAALGLDSN